MEYIDGFNLDTLLRTAADRGVYLPLIYVCHIVMEVCSALDYAHASVDERGYPLQLVHRDLSPSNIMLSWGGHVKVVDFGIAKAATQLHQKQACRYFCHQSVPEENLQRSHPFHVPQYSNVRCWISRH